MARPPAAILLAHGSPDPDWGAPARRVLAGLAARRPTWTIELAFLPPAQPDLGAVVSELAGRGHAEIRVLPLLLSGGGRHLKVDIPETLARLRAALPEVSLSLCDTALGATDEAIAAMAAAADRLLSE